MQKKSRFPSVCFLLSLYLVGAAQSVNLRDNDPCPHLKSEPRGKKLIIEPGTDKLCCGCPKDHRLITYCRRNEFNTTQCSRCPRGTAINHFAHGFLECIAVETTTSVYSTKRSMLQLITAAKLNTTKEQVPHFRTSAVPRMKLFLSTTQGQVFASSSTTLLTELREGGQGENDFTHGLIALSIVISFLMMAIVTVILRSKLSCRKSSGKTDEENCVGDGKKKCPDSSLHSSVAEQPSCGSVSCTELRQLSCCLYDCTSSGCSCPMQPCRTVVVQNYRTSNDKRNCLQEQSEVVQQCSKLSPLCYGGCSFASKQRLLHEEGQDRNDEILIEEAEQRHETKRTNNGIVDYTSEPKDETTPGREYEYQVISRQPELQDDNLDSNPQCHVASADSEPQCHDETWCAQQTERKLNLIRKFFANTLSNKTQVLVTEEIVRGFAINFDLTPMQLERSYHKEVIVYLQSVFHQIRQVKPKISAEEIVDYFENTSGQKLLAQELKSAISREDV